MNKSRNSKNIRPQILFLVFVYFGSLFLPFILMALFNIKNYAFIFLVWGIIGFYYYVIYRIGTELFWISQCLFDTNILLAYRHEAQLYNSICNGGLHEPYEILKADIPIEEIKKAVDSAEWATDDVKKYFNFMCSKAIALNECHKDMRIVIRGFGHEMPTPKLILRFKQGKLVSWRNTNESGFKWH